MESIEKSIAGSTFLGTQIEDGFYVLKSQNESAKNQQLIREIDSSFIQFHFCLKGECKFHFNNGRYTFDVLDEHALLLYNPQTDLPINVELLPNSWLVSVLLPIKKFHGLFSMEANYIHFLNVENRDKKYYDNKLRHLQK